MPCFVPFDNKKLDVSFFAFRPTGVFADELVDAMKYFSFHAEDLGCVYSSVLRSIHGNMILWYGAWLRRSPDNRKMLNDALLSVLEELSTMGVLLHHGFFEAFFGESKDGSSVAKFSSGDTIFLTAMASTPRDVADLSYACLALHRSFFAKTDGLSAGVLLRCNDQPVVAALMVWKSLHACYSWLLRSDYRNTILPYFSHLSQDSQFDVFKVVYVNCDEILNVSPFPPQTIGGGDGEQQSDH
ncbi:hypothetical protein OPV22_001328 [Ensete ventricosum]|uniref:DUF7392 domain-containing protein n=1 Tax=Ensete ventricosum TaxID=4639 RepID=A0AAV8RWA3_ENSVE|nr:hypothetical protein OPV22_001328 [Ensete ventricosum]